MSSILDVTDDSFEQDVLKSSLPALVLFWAPWSGPSRDMASVLNEIDKEYPGRVRIYKLNFDENPIIPRVYDILGVPASVLFVKGEKAWVFLGSGSRLKSAIVKSLNQYL